MSPDETGRGRPQATSTHPDGDETLNADLILVSPADNRDELVRVIDGTFVVVVKVTGGRYRRRCFLSLRAAQDAARRAQQHGETAAVVMAELRPLWLVSG
jgi:hypothetical protein